MTLDVGRLLERLARDLAAQGMCWSYDVVDHGYRATCPNPAHDDHDPSWMIRDDPGSDRHGSHHCFSCRFGGGPWELAAVVWGCDLLEAGKRLGFDARWAPAAPEAQDVMPSIRRKIFVPVPVGVVVPRVQDEWPSTYARYLETRGVPLRQATDWGIGYAAHGPLSGRVWSPIVNAQCQLVAWSARDALDRRDVPRYLESTARVCQRCGSPRFDRQLRKNRLCDCGSSRLVATYKTRGLFGLHSVVPFEDAVTLAEGAWSCLALDRAGFPNCLGLMGSDLLGGRGLSTRVHALGRFAGPIYVVTDPDSAGDRVADDLRVLDGYQGMRREVVRVRLSTSPDDAEPAELEQAYADFVDSRIQLV